MPGVDGCFCLVVTGGVSVSQTGNSSPVRKTRGRRPVKFKHSFAMNFMARGLEDGVSVLSPPHKNQPTHPNPLHATQAGRGVIWRLRRSSFSAWLPWHLFLLCNYAEVERWHGEINVPLCIFAKLMKPGIHLSPDVKSQSHFSFEVLSSVTSQLIFMHLNSLSLSLSPPLTPLQLSPPSPSFFTSQASLVSLSSFLSALDLTDASVLGYWTREHSFETT